VPAARRATRALTALTAASALTLGLVACGSGSSSSSTSSTSAGGSASGSASASASAGGSASGSASASATAATDGSIDDIKVSGGDDKTAPKIDLAKKPFGVAKYTSKVLKEGTGDATNAKSVAVVDYVLVNGTDGKTLDENFSTEAAGFDVGDESLIQGLRAALTGVKKGSRVVAALTPTDTFGPQGNAQAGVAGTDTLIFVFDVADVVTKLDAATGKTVTPKAGLPKATWQEGKPATFEMPKSDPPKELVIQKLIEGEGAKVEKGDTVFVTYTGALWRNGEVFDSSFKQSPTASFSFPVGAGKVVAGWDKGIEGQKVGSRLLLVVPPKDGYGDAGQGDIKGDDTMVFVVDILGKY